MYNLMEIKFLPFFVTPSCPSKINLPFPLTEIISLGFGWCPLDVTILPLIKTFPDSIKDIILTAILFAVFSQRNPVCMIVYHKETL